MKVLGLYGSGPVNNSDGWYTVRKKGGKCCTCCRAEDIKVVQIIMTSGKADVIIIWTNIKVA